MPERMLELQEVRVPIASDADTVVARERGRDLALRIGLSRTDATFVATAISEVARNITVHAGSGEMILADINENGRRGMIVIARDEGPGIADVTTVLRDEYESAAGLGIGLWGAKRLMDEIEITSEPGKGTTVTMRKWCGDDGVGALLQES
jgi:serine/threonine-protein kinase RsbT